MFLSLSVLPGVLLCPDLVLFTPFCGVLNLTVDELRLIGALLVSGWMDCSTGICVTIVLTGLGVRDRDAFLDGDGVLL